MKIENLTTALRLHYDLENYRQALYFVDKIMDVVSQADRDVIADGALVHHLGFDAELSINKFLMPFPVSTIPDLRKFYIKAIASIEQQIAEL